MFRFALLALLVAVASSQELCRCGAFITLESSEMMIYELPALEVNNCDQHHPCMNHCVQEFELLSGGGDLNFAAADNSTAGEILCEGAGSALHNEFVFIYSQLCALPWEWTGGQTNQPLCCDDGATYYECDTPTTPVY